MIISIGYRVNSKRATQFRQWATQRLKDYLVKGMLSTKNVSMKLKEDFRNCRELSALPRVQATLSGFLPEKLKEY